MAFIPVEINEGMKGLRVRTILNSLFAAISGDISGLETQVALFAKKIDEAQDSIEDLKPKNIVQDGLWLTDENGKALIRIDILDTLEIGSNLEGIINLLIHNNSFKLEETVEDGFYITNENGNAFAKFVDGKWMLVGLEQEEPTHKGYLTKTGDMAANSEWTLGTNSVKNNKRLAFSANISGTFGEISLGHGKTSALASWVTIDDTNVVVHTIGGNGTEVNESHAHGLTIQNNIQAELRVEHGKADIKVTSNGYTSSEIEFTLGYYYGDHGDIFVSTTSALTDCRASWFCNRLNDGIWLFGDSYFNNTSSQRWTSYLFKDGYSNFVLNGYSGEKSVGALTDLTELLKIATPKKIVWCMGMNDGDSSSQVNVQWNLCYQAVKAICEDKGIELILATIPSSYSSEPADGNDGRSVNNEHKNYIVRNSGLRYIDFSAAVGADGLGGWFEGMKNPNDVHPTEYGARALYYRAIADCPELMD